MEFKLNEAMTLKKKNIYLIKTSITVQHLSTGERKIHLQKLNVFTLNHFTKDNEKQKQNRIRLNFLPLKENNTLAVVKT